MSAATYQAIIDAIDAHLLTAVEEPGAVRFADGRQIQYRTLTELRETREYYVSKKVSAAGKPRFKVTHVKSGSAL